MRNKGILILIVVLVLVSWWAWKQEFSGLGNIKTKSSHLDHGPEDIAN